MNLTLTPVSDKSFAEYGQVLEGYDLSSICGKLRGLPCPGDGVVYVPSEPVLEEDAAYTALRDRYFGGMPIQIGYCNGVNTLLNCVEYHRDSEVNILGDDAVFLVARQQDIVDGKLDSSTVKAFVAKAGQAVELYATTLHYAPCSAKKGASFHVGVVLPKGTNTELPDFTPGNDEDKMMTARNKWLLAHPDAPEAGQGAVVGVVGENVDIAEVLA